MRNTQEWGEYLGHRACVYAMSLVIIGITGACDNDVPQEARKSSSSQPFSTNGSMATRESQEPSVSVVSPESYSRSAIAGPENTSKSQPGDYRSETIPAWRPLLNASPGQWAEYESLEGIRLRYDVLKVEPTKVTTLLTVRQDGMSLGLPATREDDPTTDELETQAKRRNAARSCNRVNLEVVGRRFDCILFEEKWDNEDITYVCRTWVSSAVPVLGTVRMELYGGDRLEASLVLVGLGDATRVRKQTKAPRLSGSTPASLDAR